MENVNLNLNKKEKLSREVTGIETDAKSFDMNKLDVETIAKNEAIADYNNRVNDYVEKFENHVNELERHAEEVNCRIETLEIKPIFNYVLVKPYDVNPFQRIEKEGDIYTGLGGKNPVYKNTDNGQWEEEENMIKVGTVLEVGTEVKNVRVGDTVMWTKPSGVPVPFFRQGLILVNENRIMVVINEKLEERFSNNK